MTTSTATNLPTATVEQGISEARIVCDSRFTAEKLAQAMLDSLHAVEGQIPGACGAARKLSTLGRVVHVAKTNRWEYAAAADALSIVVDADETLPMVALLFLTSSTIQPGPKRAQRKMTMTTSTTSATVFAFRYTGPEGLRTICDVIVAPTLEIAQEVAS